MTCKACPAAIRWVTTSAGRKMPIDAEPNVFTGTIILKTNSSGEEIAHHIDRKKSHVDGPYYTSHFATCPEAQRFRKKGPNGNA